jgi:hypothetical protein
MMNGLGKSALLAGAMVAATFDTGAVLAQWSQQAPQRQYGASSIVGSWHQVLGAPDGSVSNIFWIFQPDGRFLYTSVQMGGRQAANGTRVQYWGRYQASPAANGSVFVRIDLTGYAPLQTCMMGNCQQTRPPSSPQQGYYVVRGNTLQTNGVTAQRENAPPEMMQQLPAVWNLQPPSYNGGGDGGNGGGGVVPCVGANLSRGPDGRCHVNGRGGTCDDLQQERICSIRTGGHLYRNERTGCLVCS